jgi:hypothetical protein
MFAIRSKLLSSETIFFMQAYRCDPSQLRKTSTARSLLKTLWLPVNQVCPLGFSVVRVALSSCLTVQTQAPSFCAIVLLPLCQFHYYYFFCFAVQDRHIRPIHVLIIVVELINVCQLAEAYPISIILSPYAERFSTWLSRVGVLCGVVVICTKFFRKLKLLFSTWLSRVGVLCDVVVICTKFFRKLKLLFESTPSFLSYTKVRSVLSFPFSCILVPTFIYPSWNEFTRCYPCFMCFTCVPGIKWRSCIDYPSRGVWNSMFDQCSGPSPCDDSVICIALKSSC